MPIEENHETRLKIDCLHSLVVLYMEIKKRFPLVEVVASLGVLDPATAEYLTKYQSPMTNVTLRFPHIVPEDQLDFLDDE